VVSESSKLDWGVLPQAHKKRESLGGYELSRKTGKSSSGNRLDSLFSMFSALHRTSDIKV